jgi:hypothetical protein
MSQNASLRSARLSFVSLGVESSCDILTNWLKNGETSDNGAVQATNPVLVQPVGRYVLKVWTVGREKVRLFSRDIPFCMINF